MGFGDWHDRERKIDDFITPGNGDTDKILATIASTVVEFTNIHKTPVYAKGSSPSRTRLYQMGLNKYYEEISALFNIFGLIELKENTSRVAGWFKFELGVNYDAFLARK